MVKYICDICGNHSIDCCHYNETKISIEGSEVEISGEICYQCKDEIAVAFAENEDASSVFGVIARRYVKNTRGE